MKNLIVACAAILGALGVTPVADAATAAPANVVRGNAQDANVRVASTRGWQSTGIRVAKGKIYGTWQTGGSWTVDHRNFPRVDGAGYPPAEDAKIFQGCKLNAKWPYGLLLARVGRGRTFQVGRGQSFTAPGRGLLYLRINDADQCLSDNAGSLAVRVASSVSPLRVARHVAPGLGRASRVLLVLGFAFQQIHNLTPSEIQRISGLARSIALCEGGLIRSVPALDSACGFVIESLYSFFANPEKVS